jgi:hypothetical protein
MTSCSLVIIYVLMDPAIILRNEEQLNPRGRNRVHIIRVYGNGRKVHNSESKPMQYDYTDRGRGKLTYISLIFDNSVTTQN